jgi:hypothetical protein
MVLAIGSWRIRVPVAAAMALTRAGAAVGTPTPVGGSPDSISSTSILGTDFIRMTGKPSKFWVVISPPSPSTTSPRGGDPYHPRSIRPVGSAAAEGYQASGGGSAAWPNARRSAARLLADLRVSG